MKKLSIIFFILAFVSATQVVNAQTMRGKSNECIGSISSDGVVRNASNAQIGKIDSDGTVRNASNASIGKASGIRKSWAAAAYFFFF